MRPLGCGNVTGDLRGGDDFAFFVFDRRNGEGNIYEASVLALSNRLVVMDSLPGDIVVSDIQSSPLAETG